MDSNFTPCCRVYLLLLFLSKPRCCPSKTGRKHSAFSSSSVWRSTESEGTAASSLPAVWQLVSNNVQHPWDYSRLTWREPLTNLVSQHIDWPIYLVLMYKDFKVASLFNNDSCPLLYLRISWEVPSRPHPTLSEWIVSRLEARMPELFVSFMIVLDRQAVHTGPGLTSFP